MDRRETRGHFDALAARSLPGRLLGCGFAERYDPAAMASRPELLERIAAVLDHGLSRLRGPRRTIVDVGCGTMFYGHLLARRFERVIGVDAARAMLRAGHGFRSGAGAAALLLAEAERLPLRDGAADCVLGFDLLHHLERPGLLLAEAARALRPGGLYLGIEPNLLNPGMLAAHALPAEERGALLLNWPLPLRRAVGRHLRDPEVAFFNLGIGSGLARLAGLIHRFEPGGGSPLSLRMSVTALR
jgi:SAM-dependent methyltransferase